MRHTRRREAAAAIDLAGGLGQRNGPVRKAELLAVAPSGAHVVDLHHWRTPMMGRLSNPCQLCGPGVKITAELNSAEARPIDF